jgi:hypothetical protein
MRGSQKKAIVCSTLMLFFLGLLTSPILATESVINTPGNCLPLVKKTSILLGSHYVNNTANGNKLVTPDSGDFSHPRITQDGKDNLVIAYTQHYDPDDIRMGWSYSKDNGVNWTTLEWMKKARDLGNDIAWIDGEYYEGLFGVYIDTANSYESFYTIPNIEDPETWNFFHWASPVEDLTYVCIEDYGWIEGQYFQQKGPIGLTIQHFLYTDYDIPHCPIAVIYGFNEEGGLEGGEETFDAQTHLKTAPASNPDMSNEPMKSHFTWQYTPAEGPSKIVWKKIIPVEGDESSTDIEYTPYQSYVGEGNHPSIAHYGPHIAIVYMNNSQIICAHSHNDGETWDTSLVGVGSFPDICVAGGYFRCAYTSQGNLFLSDSKDGGITWSDPLQINDVDGTVVEEEQGIDVHEAGVVWSDSRDGTKDIYFMEGSPEATVEIRSISKGFGISVLIANPSMVDATDVQGTIRINAPLMLYGMNTPFTLDLPAGSEQHIQSGLIFGLGPATITATADTAKKIINGFVLGPLIL